MTGCDPHREAAAQLATVLRGAASRRIASRKGRRGRVLGSSSAVLLVLRSRSPLGAR